jgi:hypothetical protein
VEVHKIDEIYLMAALLSATAEKTLLSWDLNMNSLFHVLNLAKAKKIKYSGHRVLLFWSNNTKIRLNTPSWSRPRYTESANNLVKDGVNTIIISLV